MTFEFDLEVRPEFEMPAWKGLTIERPVREHTDEDVEKALENALGRHGQLVPHDGPAEPGDYITTNLTFMHNDQVLSRAEEEVIRIRPVLTFRDGKIEKFDELMVGVCAGETREHDAQLTDNAPNVALRGMQVKAVFEVNEVKRLELPELTPEFLASIGDFESEAELPRAIQCDLFAGPVAGERDLDRAFPFCRVLVIRWEGNAWGSPGGHYGWKATSGIHPCQDAGQTVGTAM